MLARLLVCVTPDDAKEWARWLKPLIGTTQGGPLLSQYSMVAFSVQATGDYTIDVTLYEFWGENGWDLVVVGGKPGRLTADMIKEIRGCEKGFCGAVTETGWLWSAKSAYMMAHPLEGLHIGFEAVRPARFGDAAHPHDLRVPAPQEPAALRAD
jgi:hypothetical protein